MVKKKNRNIIIGSVIIVLVVLIVSGLFFFAVPQTIFGGNPPHYIYASSTSRGSCNIDSPFFGELGIYRTKINVAWVEDIDEEKLVEDNDRFIFDIGLRTSSEVEGSAKLGSSIPPQEKCDGTLDCNFGAPDQSLSFAIVREDWELIDGRCFIEQPDITIYNLVNNKCVSNSISPREVEKDDFSTLSNCEDKIIKEIIVYNFENNECLSKTILETDITNDDILDILECEDLIIIEDVDDEVVDLDVDKDIETPSQDSQLQSEKFKQFIIDNTILIIIISLVIILAIILIVFRVIKNKQKR